MNEQYAVIDYGFSAIPWFYCGWRSNVVGVVAKSRSTPRENSFKEGDSPTFVLLVLAGKMQVFVERQAT